MKIAIVSPDYPCEHSNAFAFVHARSKLYRKYGNQVEVFVENKSEENYNFEGIAIHKLNRDKFVLRIDEFKPDVVAVHYPTYRIIPLIKKLDYPLVAWIHGHEILWHFRLGPSKNGIDYIKKRLVLLPREYYQIYKVIKFLDNVEHCVFVSEWTLKTAERQTFRKYKNAVVIPNPVDTELFKYRAPKIFNRAVSLRSFNNNKYGLDIAIRTFSNQESAELHICGTGRLKNKFIRLAKRINSNTTIIDKSIPHNKIPELYYHYGFFVAPSRREAQGLAMCEAMACGLPVIATNVGGIPEFVRDGIDGFLVPPNNPEKMRKAVLELISDEKRFLEMSKNARENIKNTCSGEIVVQKEIEILRKAIDKHCKN